MAKEILRNEDFSDLMKLHIREIIEFLLSKGKYFSILTNIAEVDFNPPLPPDLHDSFKPITLFVLAEYTFETSTIDKENLYFEAGFGSEDFGSFVTIPLISIVQLVIDETPVFINLASPPIFQEKENQGKGVEKSTNVFLSNPENEGLIKKS